LAAIRMGGIFQPICPRCFAIYQLPFFFVPFSNNNNNKKLYQKEKEVDK
jgi:hypothetical protein